jgi:hypothetical protein
MSKQPTGRPPLFDVPATARVTFALTPTQRVELQRVASDHQVGVSEIIREAVNEFVSDYGGPQPFHKKKP